MDFTTVFDRASDSSIDNWLFSKIEVEKELFAAAKFSTQTSLERNDLRKLLLNKFISSGEFEQAYEHYEQRHDYWYCIAEFKSWVVSVSFYGWNVHFEIASRDLDFSELFGNELKEIIPLPDPPKPNHVDFDFYMLGQDGRTNKIHRSLLTPEWEEISNNYQKDTKKQLDNLINLNPETIGDGGKLILLHGAPGLGKSYAIRALMRAVNTWAMPSYLMDPEKFFAVPPYMFDIILSSTDYDNKDKWRLIVAEDSDEFIRVDAKARSGQGLSRLLNLADGILGQGMKVIFLLTTNEPLTNLHPAVIRPGRCLANIEFKPFAKEESAQWLEVNPNSLVNQHYSLAELYDLKRVQQQIKVEKELASTGQYL